MIVTVFLIIASRMLSPANTDIPAGTEAASVGQTVADVISTEEQLPSEEQSSAEEIVSTEFESDSEGEPDTASTEDLTDRIVVIEIGSGDSLYSVIGDLLNLELISDRQEFTDYLVENELDTRIFPGIYELQNGMTMEEIAQVLTEK